MQRSLAAFPSPQPGGREGDFSFSISQFNGAGKAPRPRPRRAATRVFGSRRALPRAAPSPVPRGLTVPGVASIRGGLRAQTHVSPRSPPPSALPRPRPRSPRSLCERGAVPKRRTEPLRVRLPRGRRYNRAFLRSQAAAAAGPGPCPRRGAESPTRRRPP